MAFPSSPVNGTTYTVNGVTYVYDSGMGVWEPQGAVSTASPVSSVAGRTGAVTLTATDVGLANVTNESKATMFTNPTLTGTTTLGTVSAGAITATSLSLSGALTVGSLSGISSLNSIAIGNSTASTGAFTTLSASGAVSMASTASITGRITKSVAGGVSTAGAGRFSIGTGTQLDLHISSNTGGSGPATCQQYGITFTNASGQTQGGLVLSENNSDGTGIALYTTDSYAAGPKQSFYVDPVGHTYVRGGLGVGTTASTTTGQLLCTNQIVAFYSDERLKTKINTIENALDKIDQLTGFLYVENELAKSLGFNNPETQVALSAQAVQRVQPEATSLAPFDRADDGTSKSGENYLTVDYERLVPLLVEGIKELRREINQLKGK
jgi:hypothetical protein